MSALVSCVTTALDQSLDAALRTDGDFSDNIDQDFVPERPASRML